MRKMIIIILCCLLLVTSVAPIASATENSTPEQAFIWIDFWGKMTAQHVVKDDNTIYVPIKMLSKFGGMICHEGNSKYTFYYSGESNDKLFAKRIFIDKSGKSAQHVVYTSENEYLTIASMQFSNSYTVNGVLYLPIAEFLPLIDAKTEIDENGIVHIYTNVMPFFSALYGTNLELFNFDAHEDVVAANLVGATGMLLDTILGIKVDRLDFVMDSGTISDYKSIFKSLLTDDQIYLSAYDQEETPFQRQASLLSATLDGIDGKIGEVEDATKILTYMQNSDVHKAFKTFTKGVSEFSGVIEKGASIAGGVYKVANYYSAYVNQVDDHRNMLDAVYGGKYFSGQDPACVAAEEIENLYGSDTADQLIAATTSSLRNYVSKEVSGLVTSGLGIAPYKIAFSAVKLILPDMADTFSSSAKLLYYDRIVEDASDVYYERSNNLQLDKESLNDLRLSLMFALLTSRNAYQTYMGNEYDLVDPITEQLEQLYLAADSLECVSEGYYEAKKNELSQNIKSIQTTKYTANDDTETPPFPNGTGNDEESIVCEAGTIAAGGLSVILLADGTVVSKGWKNPGYDVSDWCDIVAISTDDEYNVGTDGHTVGLKKDGTVLATGANESGQCDITEWTDIIAVSAGNGYTIGLKSDGTLVAVGNDSFGKCDVSDWTDIVAISTGGEITAGLKTNGTAIATGGNLLDVSEIQDWSNITAISVGEDFIIGLKTDGTVVSAGQYIQREIDGIRYDPCAVYAWSDIVAISAGEHHTVGLKSDGTVVAVGLNQYGQCDVSTWTDIVEIAAGENHTIGRKSDGSLVAVGYNEYGQCEISEVGKNNTSGDSETSDKWPTFDIAKLDIVTVPIQTEPEVGQYGAWSTYISTTINYGTDDVLEHTEERECFILVEMTRQNIVEAGLSYSFYKNYKEHVTGNAMTREEWDATYNGYDVISVSVMLEYGEPREGYSLYGGQVRVGILDLYTGKTFVVGKEMGYIHSSLNVAGNTKDVYLTSSTNAGTITLDPESPESNCINISVRFLVPAEYDGAVLYTGYSDPQIENDLTDMLGKAEYYYYTPGSDKETLYLALP